jgi:hypothetical protein
MCRATPATPTVFPGTGPRRCAPPAPSSSRISTPATAAPHGTHAGAVISNGYLYCPVTPRPLLSLGPLARDATPGQTAAHDQQTAETALYKLGKITRDDADGCHRVMCPAVMGKLRCPLRPPSMSLTRQRPRSSPRPHTPGPLDRR